MFGTVGPAHVKPENREKLVEILKEQSTASVRGFCNACVMFPENRENEVILVAMFEDADSYGRTRMTPRSTRGISNTGP